MAKTFICSDESVNAYGFRVLTDGIQLSNFKKNPVGFFNHDTGGWWSNNNDYRGPIARWENIKKEDGQLKADVVFDVNDPMGKTLSDKVENDFIRAASIGFRIISTSNDPALMLQGQTGPTVTKCELIEISVVDIPANKNAIALFDQDGKRIELNDSNVSVALKAGLPVEITKTEIMKLKIKAAWTALAAFLGLTPGQDHEVELSDEKLTEMNSIAQRLQATEATLKQTQATVEQLTAQVAEKETKITELTAEVEKRKADPADILQRAAGGIDPKIKTGEEQEESLSDTDIEARAYYNKYIKNKKS